MITVYVWKPKSFFGRDFGHAALQIDSHLGRYYISFYPDKKGTSFALKGKGKLIGNYSIDCQKDHMGREADEKIQLSGLYEDDIWVAWLATETDELKYELVKNNCSSLVYSLLIIGDKGYPLEVLINDKNNGAIISSMERVNKALPIKVNFSIPNIVSFLISLVMSSSINVSIPMIIEGIKVVGDSMALFVGNVLYRNSTKLPNDVLELANRLKRKEN